MKRAQAIGRLASALLIGCGHFVLTACSQQSTSASSHEQLAPNRTNDAAYGTERHIKTGLSASNQWNLPKSRSAQNEQNATFEIAESLRKAGKSKESIDYYKKLLSGMDTGTGQQQEASNNQLFHSAEMGLARAYKDCRQNESAIAEVNKILATSTEDEEARAFLTELNGVSPEAHSP